MATPCTSPSSKAHSDTSPRTSTDETHSQASESPPEEVAGLFCKRKRKPTYYARKDELEALCKESEALTRHLDKLQSVQKCPLAKILSVNASLRAMIKRNRRTIATAQSLMDSRICGHGKPVVGSFIHLPGDPATRQRILRDMKPLKLQEALEYLLTRAQHLDLRARARQSENYVAAQEEHISILWDVSTFDGEATSVDQVFDAMLKFVRGEERTSGNNGAQAKVIPGINGTNYDIDASQMRVTTCDPPTETNLVLHAGLSPQCELLNQPHGVLSIDSVDHDEVYPYHEETHVRKDLTMAALVVESPRRRGRERRTIALVRWAQMRIHASPLATFEVLEKISCDGLRNYFDSMERAIAMQQE